jgi:hypothetical protein
LEKTPVLLDMRSRNVFQAIFAIATSQPVA